MSSLIAIEINSQEFMDKILTMKTVGTLFNYNGQSYILTCHNNIPIMNVLSFFPKEKNELTIKVNSCWSEALILNTNDINIKNYKVIKDYSNKIPKPNDKLYIIKDDEKISFTITNHEFFAFDNLMTSPQLPYIIMNKDKDKHKENYKNYPVFNESNKLVGVLSKYNTQTESFYVLPIYVFIKNLEKIDNENIYSYSVENIIKINTNIVENDSIYHNNLKIKVPLTCYFLLEGDSNKQFNLQFILLEDKSMYKKMKAEDRQQVISSIDTELIKVNKFSTTYEKDIIVNREHDNTYKMNTRLLALIRALSIFNRDFFTDIFELLTDNLEKHEPKDIYLDLDNKELTLL